MIVVTIKTDQPTASLALYRDTIRQQHISWEAHRQLAETIHLKLQSLLTASNLSLADIGGIVVFEGPGSFTGLRIGISVANALSYGLQVPIVGSGGDAWDSDGVIRLEAGETMKQVSPNYGAAVHITLPKK